MISLPEEAKVLIRNNKTSKNLRVHFPNGELEDITNKNITYDSLKFTESICSERNLKFGLLEGSSIQFEVFGIGNIKGYAIEVSLEVMKEDSTLEPYVIPLGRFVVDSCKRQSNMSRRLIVAYSNIASENTFLSPVESAKQKMSVSTDVDYEFDVFKFLASNIEWFYNENSNNFTRTEVEVETVDNVTVHFQENEFSVYGSYFKLTINFQSDLFDALLSFEKQKSSEYDFSMEDARSKLPNNVFKRLIPYIAVQNDIESESSTPGLGPALRSERLFLNFSEDYLIYPYINGISTSVDYMTFYIPKQFDYYVYIDTSPVKKAEWKFYDSCTVYRNDYNQNIMNIRTSVKRIRKNVPEFKAYRCGDIDVTSIIESYLELNGLFGKTNRSGGISFFSLQDDGLKPSEELYPQDGLYPRGNSLFLGSRTKRKLWYEEYSVKSIGSVIVDYKDEGGEDATYILQLVNNPEELNVYHMSDNFILKNTNISVEDLQNILLTYFVPNVTNITYVPADISTVGMPYLEAGDRLSFSTDEGVINTIVLERTLTGIQTLVDSIDSSGDEINEDARKIMQSLKEDL